MAFIQTVPKTSARGQTAEAYRYLEAVAPGRAPKVMEVFSLRHETLRSMARCWELAMWVGSAPRLERELLASLVSRLNECTY